MTPELLQLMASATTLGFCRDARDAEAVAVAEWFMARARRAFLASERVS